MNGVSEAKHAQRGQPRMTVAYVVLVWAGASSVTNNVVHAFRHGGGDWLLPGLYGVGPALVAVCLSHIAAEGRTGKWMRVVVVAIMLASMGGSIGATASVITPYSGTYLAWLYGLTLDAAALAALRVILSDRTRRRDESTALGQATADAEAARQQASEATGKVSGLEAELTAVKGELEAAKAQVHALRDTLNKRRASRRSSPRKKAPSSPVNNSGEPDIDTQAEALRILAEKPDISGGELGQRLGVSKSYGCRLKRELTVAAPGPEGAQP